MAGWEHWRLFRAWRMVGDIGPVASGRPACLVANVIRYAALLAAGIVVARTASSVAVLWGLPLAGSAVVWTACAVTRSPGARLLAAWLLTDVGFAAAAVAATGGWHSGWVIVLIAESALCGVFIPMRLAGPAGAAAVIGLFCADLAAGGSLRVAGTFDLDALAVIATLSISYATWLVGFADADEARLTRLNRRLLATNDLLVTLDEVLLRGEDFTDPHQAAVAIARTCRDLIGAEVVVVASTTTAGASWRVLLAEGVAVGPSGDSIAALRSIGAEPSVPMGEPVRTEVEPGLLAPDSRSGVCVPLSLRGRLVGAVIIETPKPAAWGDAHLQRMAQMGRWAALLVDNSSRFHALWVVGSAEQRSRAARGLHDSLGQNLAALGLQLDAIARTSPDAEWAARVKALRGEVTGMVAELRHAMRDLVCDVSEERSLASALDLLVRGISERSDTTVVLDVEAEYRLPLAHEHQLLQIARDLLDAALRSRTPEVHLRWVADLGGGYLRVRFSPARTVPLVLAGASRGERQDGTPADDAPDDEVLRAAVLEARAHGWAVGATVGYHAGADGSRTVTCHVGSWLRGEG